MTHGAQWRSSRLLDHILRDHESRATAGVSGKPLCRVSAACVILGGKKYSALMRQRDVVSIEVTAPKLRCRACAFAPLLRACRAVRGVAGGSAAAWWRRLCASGGWTCGAQARLAIFRARGSLLRQARGAGDGGGGRARPSWCGAGVAAGGRRCRLGVERADWPPAWLLAAAAMLPMMPRGSADAAVPSEVGPAPAPPTPDGTVEGAGRSCRGSAPSALVAEAGRLSRSCGGWGGAAPRERCWRERNLCMVSLTWPWSHPCVHRLSEAMPDESEDCVCAFSPRAITQQLGFNSSVFYI